MRRRLRVLCLLAVACAPAANAATFVRSEVTHEDDRYRVLFEVRLDAPSAAVHRLLTDYDHLDRLSPIVIESRRLPRTDSSHERVRIVVEACMWVFCKTVRRVMDVEQRPDGDILSLADPSQSDFRHVREHWQIFPETPRTRLRYEAEYVPGFYVPPLLGPWLIKRRLHNELIVVFGRLEELAGK